MEFETLQSYSTHTIDDVLDVCKTYLKDENNLNLIYKAYECAKKEHEGQFRKSGEPYIIHPTEVAYTLATLHAGPFTIAAGFLHDVLEDTSFGRERMIEEFGEEVTNIVDGVTKISKLKYMTQEKILANNHQKILLAMAKDIRVVLVKLVDRLHNIRTLKYQSPEKQKSISKETLDLYAPLAHRLGMYRLKAELEDTSLSYLLPDEYNSIKDSLAIKKIEKEQDIEIMVSKIRELLDKNNIKNYQIKGRIKNIYSIYKKIITKSKTMDDIYDFLALRVIVDSVEDCYRVLGLVHSLWTPIPMRFKDYIAVPKSNMYQSLHTTIIGVDGKVFEIQIRTSEMDDIAENGIAAHWAYKENAGYSAAKEQLEITNKLKWYKDLETYVNEDQQKTGLDPLNNIIDDIFNASVYVFTPKGDVLELPQGSTPIDFAFRIHSDVGSHLSGALVNGKIVPLNYTLKTGDVVSIKTLSNATPKAEWLKIAKTNHARSKIKAYINKVQYDELVEKGKNSLEEVAKQLKFDLKVLEEKETVEKLNIYNASNFTELCYELGKGNSSALSIINKIIGENDVKLTDDILLEQYKETEKQQRRIIHNASGVIVDGLDNPTIKLGNCCQPIKGDEIVGYVTKGKGIVVHRLCCPNLESQDSDRSVNVRWDNEVECKYSCTIKIYSLDRRNGVADMINALNAVDVSITSVSSSKNSSGECITKFKLEVKDLESLNHAIINLNKLSEIYKIERVIK